jgi:hypothetical protein
MSDSPDQLAYYRTAERPEILLWLEDANGALVDFSVAGYTFEFKLGYAGQAAVFTKTDGIDGAAGSGVAPPGVGTPNITITPVAGWFDTVAAKHWTWQLRATKDGLDRLWQGPFQLAPVIS